MWLCTAETGMQPVAMEFHFPNVWKWAERTMQLLGHYGPEPLPASFSFIDPWLFLSPVGETQISHQASLLLFRNMVKSFLMGTVWRGGGSHPRPEPYDCTPILSLRDELAPHLDSAQNLGSSLGLTEMDIGLMFLNQPVTRVWQ